MIILKNRANSTKAYVSRSIQQLRLTARIELIAAGIIALTSYIIWRTTVISWISQPIADASEHTAYLIHMHGSIAIMDIILIGIACALLLDAVRRLVLMQMLKATQAQNKNTGE